MKVAHVDPFSGASGDMLLGAVLDAGVALETIVDAVGGLGVDGWDIRAEAVTRAGVGATRVHVTAREDGVVRTWANVRELLGGASLAEPVRARALSTFRRIAEAEARIHRRPVERVHFHEVGALDAIVDIVGVCAGLHALGVERVTCGPVAQGTGMTRGDHGLLPVPAPAVLALLAGAPTYSTGEPVELCTPTGAALLAEWTDEWVDLPQLVVGAVGYGAGARELDRPNVVRIVLGQAAGYTGASRALVLATAIDDLPGELVPPVLDALRAAGAHDAWACPVVMKKGRPGVELVCLADPERGDALRRVLFTETTTLGVRGWFVDKWALERRWVTVDVAGQPVRLKVGALDDAVVNVAPEFDDALAAGAATGLPVKEVLARARAAWHAKENPPPPGGPAPASA
ncbi:MAG TPA: nickel pincer cofactor biosynthesis protein LarC [Egibacteraceae bacterium]|nr:nickel pincer cofactor biosynthesis protein LarC [Egibacteraceae bacterium]